YVQYVVVDGALGEAQRLGNPTIGQPARQKPKDLDLACCQAKRPGTSARCASMARGDEHRLGCPFVQPPGLDLAPKFDRRVRGRMGWPMHARLDERVVHVGSAEDARAVREQRAAQADVVARTVDAFVVAPGQNAERGE